MRTTALALPGALEDDLVMPWAHVEEDLDEAVFEDEDDDWDDLDDPDELVFEDDEDDWEEDEDEADLDLSVADDEDEAVGW
jgi:hypothetical protein